jgi:hypothetical protein
MKKLSALLVLFAFLFSQTANAVIINSLPYNLTNGSLADATQVMANYNQIVNNTNTNAAHNGANSDITSLTGLTTPLANTYGGTVIFTGGTTAGTANVQTLVTVTPSSYANTAGNIVTAIAGVSNTAAMTLAVNSQTAKSVKVEDGTGLHDPSANAVLLGNSYLFYYDGTEFILENPSIFTSGVFPSAFAIPATWTATTQAAGDTTTAVATDAFVNTTALTLASGTTATTQATSDNSTKVATTAYVHTYFPYATTINSLSGDVSLNNTANYFDGPAVAQGTTGTFLVTGQITVRDTAATATVYAKLWDGTTVCNSASTGTPSTANANDSIITLSCVVTNPAANMRISARDITSTNGVIKFNVSGNSKDSTLTAVRLQ